MKSIILVFTFILSAVGSGIYAQGSINGSEGPADVKYRSVERNQHPSNHRACKKMKGRTMHKMRRMAAADGYISKGERRMLKREKRRIY